MPVDWIADVIVVTSTDDLLIQLPESIRNSDRHNLARIVRTVEVDDATPRPRRRCGIGCDRRCSQVMAAGNVVGPSFSQGKPLVICLFGPGIVSMMVGNAGNSAERVQRTQQEPLKYQMTIVVSDDATVVMIDGYTGNEVHMGGVQMNRIVVAGKTATLCGETTDEVDPQLEHAWPFASQSGAQPIVYVADYLENERRGILVSVVRRVA